MNGASPVMLGTICVFPAPEPPPCPDGQSRSDDCTCQTAAIKPNGQPRPGPMGNTQGIIVPDTAPNPHGNSAPDIEATPEEKGWWSRWGSAATHLALDVVGLIPVVGEIADGANALIYLAEGDVANAALSAAAMVPGAGVAATTAKIGKKAAKEATERAAKEAAEKAAKEAAEKAAKEAAEKAAAEAAAKGTREAAEGAAGQGAKKAEGKGGGKDQGKGKGKGPCDHLRQGSGKGAYRGGAHSKTSKPANDGKDSHHMPAKDSSPLDPMDGPAIQMDPTDHHETASNGRRGSRAAAYRDMLETMLKNGEWRKAMTIEIQDIREIAKGLGDPRKYNEAMLEMLEYFKCLEKNGLLP